MITRHFAFKANGAGWDCRVLIEKGRYRGEDYETTSVLIEDEYHVPRGALEAEIVKWQNHLLTWEDQETALAIFA